MKKTWFLLILATLCALALCACTSNADTMESPSPSPSASMQPTESMAPTQSTMPAQSAQPAQSTGITTLDDAVRLGGELATDLQKLSEVKDAVVITAGSMAIVGLEFDTQYQGGMTDRITGMVEQRAAGIDSGLTTVVATDDPALVEKIRALAEQAESKSITFSELQNQALMLGTEIEGQGSAPSATQGGTGA